MIRYLHRPSFTFTTELTETNRQWIKYIVITGSAAGVLVMGTFLYKRYVRVQKRSDQKPKQNGKIHRIGSVKHDEAHHHHEESDSFAQQKGITSSISLQPKPACGLAVLLENKQRDSYATPTFSKARSSSQPTFMRRRTDSSSSRSTSFRNSRSPSEMVLLSLESVKRAVRLLEESKSRIQVLCGEGADNEFDFILTKAKQLVDDLEEYRRGITPERDDLHYLEEYNGYIQDDTISVASSRDESIITSTTLTLPFFDVEPNIHFFNLYMEALELYDNVLPPRVDRTSQLGCESETEFRAKVYCLKQVFELVFEYTSNQVFYIEMGKDILQILLTHSLRDPTECLAAYDSFLEYVTISDNQKEIEEEIKRRGIPGFNFYDLVLDYMIMDSFDDLDDPPSAVLSVANNRWLSSGFRELALQTAVSAVLKHKKSKLTNPNGFFGHFYQILDHVSPILAWGFLGTDYDLRFKCNLIKDSIYALIRDYFSFDRVRYTTLNDLSEDILKVTEERYLELQSRLSICNS